MAFRGDGIRRLFRIRGGGADAVRAEMREEVEAHLALCTEQLIRRGIPADVALIRARARFGDFDATVQRLYESAILREGHVQRREFGEAFRQDLALSLRQMRRAPGFTTAVML